MRIVLKNCKCINGLFRISHRCQCQCRAESVGLWQFGIGQKLVNEKLSFAISFPEYRKSYEINYISMKRNHRDTLCALETALRYADSFEMLSRSFWLPPFSTDAFFLLLTHVFLLPNKNNGSKRQIANPTTKKTQLFFLSSSIETQQFNKETTRAVRLIVDSIQ